MACCKAKFAFIPHSSSKLFLREGQMDEQAWETSDKSDNL
jgi:hypothetical protein